MMRPEERGSATVELALLTPLLVVFLLFVVEVGRLVLAGQEVNGAAVDAARAASVATSPSSAVAAAAQAASSDLSGAGFACSSSQATVDTTDFVPGGTVSVHLTCSASLAGLSLLRLPGSETFRATATAPIDLYRSVAP